MLDGFSIKSLGLGRGKYKPVAEQSGHDGAEEDHDIHSQKPSKRPSFLWLYLMLSAFCGFIFAIAMVNLFPDNLIKGGDTAQTKLQKFMQCKLFTLLGEIMSNDHQFRLKRLCFLRFRCLRKNLLQNLT